MWIMCDSALDGFPSTGRAQGGQNLAAGAPRHSPAAKWLRRGDFRRLCTENAALYSSYNNLKYFKMTC